jgi:hypothetical protein
MRGTSTWSMILAATMRGVTIIEGQLFPRLQKCPDAVLFELVRSAPDSISALFIPSTYCPSAKKTGIRQSDLSAPNEHKFSLLDLLI